MFDNVRHVIGEVPSEPQKISDMEKGESGYTVPWAYKDGYLDTDFTIGEKRGTACLWVECVDDNEYVLEFEKPKYRSVFEPLKEV